MSSITPSQQISLYTRSLGEMENDLKEDAARSRKGVEEQVKTVEDNYVDAQRKQEKEYEDTVNDIRDNYTDRLEQQKHDYEAQLSEARYNRYGRMEPAAEGELRKQNEELRRTLEQERTQSAQHLSNLQEGHERQVRNLNEAHNQREERNAD
ncbi:MAG TPA: hypothetical protein VL588_08345, partial [Bdellovibrionota bacterium]|nr:hypothetical protein [Bdellovibrionota bacterium]